MTIDSRKETFEQCMKDERAKGAGKILVGVGLVAGGGALTPEIPPAGIATMVAGAKGVIEGISQRGNAETVCRR